jgi:hypothetical protein
MIIPIEPLKENEEGKATAGSAGARSEKGFAIVGRDPGSPRACFERRAEEIARAAEIHVRKMVEQEAELVATPPPREIEPWAADAVERDAVPFGLKRRVVLRVPVIRRETPETTSEGAEEILLPEDLGRVSEETRGASSPARADAELRRVRSLMAQVALDLIAQVIEINRYFAAAGFVKPPEVVSPGEAELQEREASSGKTMSGGSAGSSLRRRA